MRYAAPHEPSPEEEIIARAAAELFRHGDVSQFYVCVNTVIGGVRECDVLVARLAELGVPRHALIVEPSADTTDGELEVFKRHVGEHTEISPSTLSIEAKRGRMDMIQRAVGFHPPVYWAEEVLADSGAESSRRFVAAWRRSFRYGLLRFRLGILPMLLMTVDPHARLARWLARTLRHRS
jgi:hypothetical protein